MRFVRLAAIRLAPSTVLSAAARSAERSARCGWPLPIRQWSGGRGNAEALLRDAMAAATSAPPVLRWKEMEQLVRSELEMPPPPPGIDSMSNKQRKTEMRLLRKAANAEVKRRTFERMKEVRDDDPKLAAVRRLRELGAQVAPHWSAVMEIFATAHSMELAREARFLLAELLFHGEAQSDAERLTELMVGSFASSQEPQATRAYARKTALDAIALGGQLSVSDEVVRTMDIKGWNAPLRALRCTEATAEQVRDLLASVMVGDERFPVGPVGERPERRADLAIQCLHALTAMGGELAAKHALAFTTALHAADIARSTSGNPAKRGRPLPTREQEQRARVALFAVECLTHLAETGALSDADGVEIAHVLAGEGGLKHWHWGVSTRAATALGALGAHAAPHIDELERRLYGSPSDKPRRTPYKLALVRLGRTDVVERIERDGYLTTKQWKARRAEKGDAKRRFKALKERTQQEREEKIVRGGYRRGVRLL